MNYQEQIKQTLQGKYDEGVIDGKRLGMVELHCKVLELRHAQPNVDVVPYIDEMIEELLNPNKMTPEQYEADAKADHKTSEQF